MHGDKGTGGGGPPSSPNLQAFKKISNKRGKLKNVRK
jgi:hypothetical protein